MDSEGRCADAIDLYPKLLQKETEVLHHIVGAGVANRHDAWVERCRHDNILSDGVAALSKDDSVLNHMRVSCCLVVIGRCLDSEAKGCEARHVWPHRPCAKVAPTREWDLE